MDNLCKRDATLSGRKNYKAYEERKLANQERDRIFAERIRMERK
jgi:hypothetical protein